MKEPKLAPVPPNERAVTNPFEGFAGITTDTLKLSKLTTILHTCIFRLACAVWFSQVP
jgi:hypothetical protein